MLPYLDFLDRVIADGIEAAKADYANDLVKLQGAWEGFKSCRGKTPPELIALYEQAMQSRTKGQHRDSPEVWRWICFAAEIEWTLNVLSAALRVSLLAWLPTARGVLKAAEILGVRTTDGEEERNG